MELRIHKWIAELGLASRREAETWIEEGRVKVNGKVVKSQGLTVDPESDSILLDGKKLPKTRPAQAYFLLNKPDLVLTSRKGDKGKFTIYDLPRLKRLRVRVNPVGRLDFRTEGLLLLSNDGELAHKLMHPRNQVPRVYSVLLPAPLKREQEQKIRRGLYFPDGPVKGIKIEKRNRTRMGASRGQWYRVTVREGRNRLIRRIFAAVGVQVVRLVRIGYGDLRLPARLKVGEVLELGTKEVNQLKKAGAGKYRRPRPSRTNPHRKRQLSPN